MKILLILYSLHLYAILCINSFKISKILHYAQILFVCLYLRIMGACFFVQN